MEKQINKWKELTNKIAESWIIEYFQLSDEEVASGIEYYWIGNEVGGIFQFADYYVAFSNVVECYELNISRDGFFEWHNFCLNNHTVKISLAQYILSPQERLEAQEKHLAELKDRIDLAEREFKEALNNYTSPSKNKKERDYENN